MSTQCQVRCRPPLHASDGIDINFLPRLQTIKPDMTHIFLHQTYSQCCCFGQFYRLEKGNIFIRLSQKHNCTVFTNFQRTKLYSFQNLRQGVILKIFVKCRKFQPDILIKYKIINERVYCAKFRKHIFLSSKNMTANIGGSRIFLRRGCTTKQWRKFGKIC